MTDSTPDETLINDLETLWIVAHRSYVYGEGYNCSLGGEGLNNPSEEIRRKIGAAGKGRPGYWLGKKMPQEMRDRMSASRKGRKTKRTYGKRSLESNKKTQEGLLKFYETHESPRGFMGKKHTLKSLQLMSEKQRGHSVKESTKAKIIEHHTIKIDVEQASDLYKSGLTLQQVGKKLGVSGITIGRRLAANNIPIRPDAATRSKMAAHLETSCVDADRQNPTLAPKETCS